MGDLTGSALREAVEATEQRIEGFFQFRRKDRLRGVFCSVGRELRGNLQCRHGKLVGPVGHPEAFPKSVYLRVHGVGSPVQRSDFCSIYAEVVRFAGKHDAH